MRSFPILVALAAQAGAETLHFTSASATRDYGLMLTAPDSGCRAVRYVLSGPMGVLGHTPPLQPGERAVVRMGRGHAPGDHPVTVETRGCVLHPVEVRRVTLRKASPDHGWRASLILDAE